MPRHPWADLGVDAAVSQHHGFPPQAPEAGAGLLQFGFYPELKHGRPSARCSLHLLATLSCGPQSRSRRTSRKSCRDARPGF